MHSTSRQDRGGARHFHLGGPLEGPVLQQGELSMVCVGLQCSGMTSRGKFWRGHWGARQNFGGAVAPPSSAPAPRSGNKTIHYKILHKRIFAGEGSTELKLLMSHLQQLFTLHWYRRLRHNNDYSTYWHQRQMDFSMEWPKKNF